MTTTEPAGNNKRVFASTLNPWTIAIGTTLILAAYQFCFAVYYLYFHPLSHIPGPWYAALSRIPYIRAVIRGTTTNYLQKLHATYGDVVRYSPNEISFISGETAWQDIYGFRTGRNKGVGSFEKDLVWVAPSVDNVDHMLRAQGDNHGRQRRILAHAFSMQALKDQEGLLMQYADLLMSRLKEESAKGEAIDMCRYFNWTTFDIIADLTFGEPFGCLADLATHPYVDMILNAVKGIRFYYVKSYWPWVNNLGSLLIDKVAVQRRLETLQWVKKQTHKRMGNEMKRPDFTALILEHRNDHGEKQSLSDAEIVSNAAVLLTAGTETTATVLSAATFLLLKHPEIMVKVTDEVRSRFKNQEEITVDAVNELTYMIACLTEALRYLPPVPAGFIRKVPRGGAEISGYHVPGDYDVSVSVSQHASYHSERNFKDPDSFIPERWLDDARYSGDNKAAFQPFSFGPRNCIGKNLAYAEMRLILAKLIYNFDFELDERCQDWDKDMKVMILWQKPPLFVKIKEAHPI